MKENSVLISDKSETLTLTLVLELFINLLIGVEMGEGDNKWLDDNLVRFEFDGFGVETFLAELTIVVVRYHRK